MEHLLRHRVGEREALDDAIGQRREAARLDELPRRTRSPHRSSTSTSSSPSAAATAVDGNSPPAMLAASSSRCSSGASRSICFSTISRRLSGTPVATSSSESSSTDAVLALAQALAVHQIAEHRDEKERVAVGALEQQPREILRQLVRARGGHRGTPARRPRSSSAERQLRAEVVELQVLLHRAQRVLVEHHVAGAVGADDQHARRLAATRQRRDEIDRRAVAPVGILEHQHERRLGAERFDGFGHLAQHALARGAAHLFVERGTLVGLHERRHLRAATLARSGERASTSPA